MKYINSFNFKCYLSHSLNAKFWEEIIIPFLGSVAPDFQGVQIAFTHVVQHMFLQSREVGKDIIIPISLRAGCNAHRGEVIFSESPEGTDSITIFPANPFKDST